MLWMQNAVNSLLVLPVIHRMPQANNVFCCDSKDFISQRTWIQSKDNVYTPMFTADKVHLLYWALKCPCSLLEAGKFMVEEFCFQLKKTPKVGAWNATWHPIVKFSPPNVDGPTKESTYELKYGSRKTKKGNIRGIYVRQRWILLLNLNSFCVRISHYNILLQWNVS